MEFPAKPHAAFVRVALVLLVLVVSLWMPASGQNAPPRAEPPPQQPKQITGVIASVDDSCSSFVLLQQADGQETETTFHRNPSSPPWSDGLDGCNFVSTSGDKTPVAAGLRVTVTYTTGGARNLVSGIGPSAAPAPIVKSPCKKEGEAGGVPQWIYSPACEGTAYPACVYCPGPPYTEKARKARLQGTVLLELTILPDGTTSDVKLLREFDTGLDQSALNTVAKWRFKPIIGSEGQAVAVKTPVEVTFALTVRPASREKPLRAVERLPPTNALFGKIISIERGCGAFIVQLEDDKKTRAKLIVSPERSHWSPAPQGYSFVSIAGTKMVLKPDTWVSVHYLTLEPGNVVTWVIVRRDKTGPACKGQGGADETPETIFSAGCDGVSLPDCVRCDNPKYPPLAPNGIVGSVWVNVVIAPDGQVAGAWLLRGLQKDLDRNTITAVQQWRFEPIIGPGGKPVWAASPVEVIFRRP